MELLGSARQPVKRAHRPLASRVHRIVSITSQRQSGDSPWLRPGDRLITPLVALTAWAIAWFAGQLLGSVLLAVSGNDKAGDAPIIVVLVSVLILWFCYLVAMVRVSRRYGTGQFAADFGDALAAEGEILAAGLPELAHSRIVLLGHEMGPLGEVLFTAEGSGTTQRLSQAGQEVFIDGYPDSPHGTDADRLRQEYGPTLHSLALALKSLRSYIVLLESPDGAASKVIYRTARDARYRYIRNFTPHVPLLAFNEYKGKQYPVWNLLTELHAQGKLTEPQEVLCQPTMSEEELYDLDSDPWEINKLAKSDRPEHQAELKKLRAVVEKWM